MTGAERKRVWREKRKPLLGVIDTAPAVERHVSTFVTDYPAARAAILKTFRTEVRLKHSLAADTELATLTPKINKIMDRMGTSAMLPSIDVVKKCLNGKPFPKM